MLFLVRHAKAGDRVDNAKRDFVRPLSRNGWAQASALVEPLAAAGATGPLLSSPYARCIQTLEPLARRLHDTVVADERLREGAPFQPVVEAMATMAEGTVLCSHGDVIPDVIVALERRGCVVVGEPQWKKASVWVIERDDNGQFVTASSWPPPA